MLASQHHCMNSSCVLGSRVTSSHLPYLCLYFSAPFVVLKCSFLPAFSCAALATFCVPKREGSLAAWMAARGLGGEAGGLVGGQDVNEHAENDGNEGRGAREAGSDQKVVTSTQPDAPVGTLGSLVGAVHSPEAAGVAGVANSEQGGAHAEPKEGQDSLQTEQAVQARSSPLSPEPSWASSSPPSHGPSGLASSPLSPSLSVIGSSSPTSSGPLGFGSNSPLSPVVSWTYSGSSGRQLRQNEAGNWGAAYQLQPPLMLALLVGMGCMGLHGACGAALGTRAIWRCMGRTGLHGLHGPCGAHRAVCCSAVLAVFWALSVCDLPQPCCKHPACCIYDLMVHRVPNCMGTVCAPITL